MVAMVQQGAAAKTAREVNQIAKAITVKIDFKKQDSRGNSLNGNGSGILLRQDGDIYMVLTAAHVTKEKAGEKITKLTIETPDGQQHGIVAGSMRAYAGDVDLAVAKFRSGNKYKLANLGNSDRSLGGYCGEFRGRNWYDSSSDSAKSYSDDR